MTSTHLARGVVASLIATLLLSIIMITNNVTGRIPQLNVIALLTSFAHKTVGTPMVPGVGWLMHISIGSIFWGVLFGFTSRLMPFRHALADALSFAMMAWVLMMIILMPATGNGPLGLNLSLAVPVATFVLHGVYGIILGLVFGGLRHLARDEASAQ